MRRFARENSLSLVFGGMLLLALLGESYAGWRDQLAQLSADGLGPIGYWRYVTSADFAVDVAENWQSEFLQFFLYIFLTVWLVQRGSPESKEPGKEGPGSDEEELLGDHVVEGTPRLARGGFRGVTRTRSARPSACSSSPRGPLRPSRVGRRSAGSSCASARTRLASGTT